MTEIDTSVASRMIKKVVRITTNKQQPSDYQYWITRPYKERIDAIEMLRQAYMDSRKDIPARLQRVCRITRQE